MNQDSAGRLVERLRSWVADAPPGTRLPSSRALVAQHGVSPVTVHKAVQHLVAQGLVESRPGVGTFTLTAPVPRTADLAWQTAALGARPALLPGLASPQRSGRPDAVELRGGYPDPALLPERLVRAALARASRGDAAVQRMPPAGLPELRAWFAREAGRHARPGVTPPGERDALVVAGLQGALGSVFRTLVGSGGALVIESPTYWGALLAAAQTGVRLVPVPSGPDGPDPDVVDHALATSGARAFYAQPTFANPTGGRWSEETGRAVLAAVRRHGCFLVEDDWAHDLAIDVDPRPLVGHDDDGHVVYLRTLTKSVSPALRVGAIVARGPARDRILADRAAQTMYVSGVLQAAALDVVTQPGWARHLRTLRAGLRVRRDELLEALTTHAPEVEVAHRPVGGIHLWLRLPDGTDPAEVVRRCEQQDVLLAAGDEWFPAEPTGPYLRAGFAGADRDRFAEAAQVLGAVVREVATAR